MKKFFGLMMMLVSVQALAAQTIPTDKKVCTLMIEGTSAIVSAYSCDGEAPVQLESVSKDEASFAEISGQIVKFINAGYTLVNCQYVVGQGMSPQYVCNFIHQ